jgi:hypothetical protein
VRATRAYLAGFGTSGSLLAGAALMFLLASAFVAFQGWPAVAGQSSPVSVSIPRVAAGAGSRDSRVLAAFSGAHPGATAQGARAGGRAGSLAVQGGRLHRASSHTLVTPVSSDPGPGTGTTNSTHTGSCSGCGGGPGGQVLSAVKQAVSNTASGAGSAVGNAVSTVEKLLPKSGVGGTVTHVVTASGNTAGQVVTTTQSVVKSLTGGLP